MPRLSIITVTYKAEPFLPLTLASVAAQTWRDWEHLFIDGASPDGTLALIQQYAEQVPHVRYLSEPDRGLYDAMNKGLALARGEFVCFLNAGDSFWAADTLEKLFTKAPPEVDVLYGDHVYVDAQGQLLDRPRHRPYPHGQLEKKHFQTGMAICHQALIVRRALAPAYDLTYRIAADLDWTIRLLDRKPRTYDSNLRLIRYLEGGLSTRQRLAYVRERTRIIYRHFGLGGVLKSLGAIGHRVWSGGYPGLS